MPVYLIKNGSHVDKAFKVYGGHEIVRAGDQGTVETLDPLSDEMLAALERDGVEVSEGDAKPAAPSGPVAQHRGGGRYFVMDGDVPLGEAMSKDDAEAFNALSDEDKAAFLKKD
ncbi:putative protein OS=Bosea thiooxidans OX=53254 GN=SAMN05660750_03333 PE=4 SV=1 [Bosea thiooxidans]|uniref:Uncharacterized protein n=1 Tax=Bosea thiooxidans TaxID=53254 RepID=A0A1T5FLG8_9HYPH|nr:hypothetical protein [Bosea thiooxidans]SKB96995.1 hypothetical protein SAMN05660750_03333 [Bosea thiooxidans]